MKRLCLISLLLLTSCLLPLTSPAFAVEPIFKPGGPGSRCNASDYQDRSNPGCYVQEGATSTYNVYIPQSNGPRRGADPNVSETCFVASQPHIEFQPAGFTPSYQVVTDHGTTYIDTPKTELPWDIPNLADFTKNSMDTLAHYYGDIFGLQGNTTTPTKTQLKTIVDQNGAIEKLQPLYFQVKDRVDYCRLLETAKIFDEPVNFSVANQDQALLLSQICSTIPGPVRSLGDNWLEALISWRQTNPTMAEAFHQIRPHSSQDQAAWMVVYMYQYEYPDPAATPVINPNPIGGTPKIIKLNLPITATVQSQQTIDQMLVPALTDKASRPAGFPVTAANMGAVQAQVINVMQALGYQVPQNCGLPPFEGEAQTGPPVGQNLFQQIISAINTVTGGHDATIPTTFVGRCEPQQWHKTTKAGGDWECRTTTSALANVFLLNPEYLKVSCNEQYLEAGSTLRTYFPSQFLTQENSAVPSPSPKPLLPIFEVTGAQVRSPGRNQGPAVDLPTSCQAEIAQAKNAILGKLDRPSKFLNQPLQVQPIYQAKINSLFQSLQSLFQNLFQ